MRILLAPIFLAICSFSLSTHAQVNHAWNEALLESIRNDVAKPVVHSRNLYHHSLGMYNLFDQIEKGGEQQLDPVTPNSSGHDIELAWTGFSVAFITSRYQDSPGWAQIASKLEDQVLDLHGDVWSHLETHPSAAYGYNYGLAIDSHFMNDGANQTNGYTNTCYTPKNAPLEAKCRAPL